MEAIRRPDGTIRGPKGQGPERLILLHGDAAKLRDGLKDLN